MTVANEGIAGYRTESSYSVRNPLTPLVTDQPIKFGEWIEGNMPQIPKAKHTPIERFDNTKLRVSDLRYGKLVVEGEISFQLINGIPLLYALGGNVSHAGTDPYTHTITELTPGDTKLSRTYHFEKLGGTEEKKWDFPGTLTKQLELTALKTSQGNGLVAKESFISQRVVDDSAGSNPAVKYNNAPAVPSGSGTTPYYWTSSSVATHEANSLLNMIETVTILITNTWKMMPGNTRSGTDEYSKNVKRWAEDYILTRQDYSVSIALLRGDTNSFDIEEALYAETLSNDLVFKWLRSTNDYIQFTFDTTQCLVTDITDWLPEFAISDKYAIYRLQPRSVSIEVKDSIPGASFL